MVYKKEGIECFLGDCIPGMATLPSGSVNVIFTDPPYKYLKNQVLETDFNEAMYFEQAKRILSDDGFIVLFGRGTSFYRWNTMLADLGFKFKEEIVWDKSYCSSPLMPISRVHETVSIHTKGKGVVNKVKVPYLDMKSNDIPSIIQDIKRMKSILNNTKSLNAVLDFLETGQRNDFEKSETFSRHDITNNNTSAGDGDRCVKVINSITRGMNEKTIIKGSERKHKNSASVQPCTLINEDRSAAVARILENGMNEKTIIKSIRDHYKSIHPTQKPVALLKRILKLVTNEGDMVVDTFLGSWSMVEACIDLNLKFKGWEIHEPYFSAGRNRIENYAPQKELFA